jgi:hypothetical protein
MTGIEQPPRPAGSHAHCIVGAQFRGRAYRVSRGEPRASLEAHSDERNLRIFRIKPCLGLSPF